MIAICAIAGVVGDYKKAELEYKKFDLEITQKAMEENVSLSIEKERTKQHLIDKERESERTEQLRIKSDYTEKYHKELYG